MRINLTFKQSYLCCIFIAGWLSCWRWFICVSANERKSCYAKCFLTFVLGLGDHIGWENHHWPGCKYLWEILSTTFVESQIWGGYFLLLGSNTQNFRWQEGGEGRKKKATKTTGTEQLADGGGRGGGRGGQSPMIRGQGWVSRADIQLLFFRVNKANTAPR